MKLEKICPKCHKLVRFIGEGGYGKCTNDECKFEMKLEECHTKDCDEFMLDKKDLFTEIE